MTLKILLASIALSFSSLATAAQITKTPIYGVALSYNQNTGNVYATGKLISGKIITNSLYEVTINNSLIGKFEVDSKGLVRLAMKNSGAFLIGQANKDNSVVLDVPFQAYQVSERYDVIEKSFGQVDVEYIAVDVQL